MNNIYLFYGLDASLISNEIKKITGKEEIIKYDISNIENIIEEVTTIGLFNNKKCLVIDFNDYNKIDLSILEDYINKKNDDNILIFYVNNDKLDNRKKIIKTISNKGKITELKKDITYLTKYITNYLEDYKMDKLTIDYFIKRVGSNIDNITNELDKLKMYKIDSKSILIEDIDLLIEKVVEDEIFALNDAITKKDTKKALELYHAFLEQNCDITQIIGLLASNFRFLYQVKRLYNKNKSNDEIAKILEVHPYRVKLAINNSYNYLESDYLHYIKKLANWDRDIKLNNISKDMFELFIINKDM